MAKRKNRGLPQPLHRRGEKTGMNRFIRTLGKYIYLNDQALRISVSLKSPLRGDLEGL
jgi:hypothetical protein